MNKDALLATIIGFVVGLFITGLLLVGPRLVSLLPKISLPKPTATPTPAIQNASFTIDSPLPETIESSSELLVSGSSEPGAMVVIQTDVDDEVVLAGQDGKYAGKVTLVEGKNDLTVTSYGKTKQEAKTIQVFYTPEAF